MKAREVVFKILKAFMTIAIVMVIAMFVVNLSAKAYDFGFRIFSEEPMTPAPGYTTSVAIVEGKSVMEIGQILEEKGLIRSAFLFYFQEFVSDYHGMLQPGVYQLSTAMTPEEMMAIMAAIPDEDDGEISGNSESSISDNAIDDYSGMDDYSEIDDTLDADPTQD